MQNFNLLQISRLALMVFLLIFVSCKASRTVKGGAIGGTAGGVVGGMIGKKAGSTAVGIIIGSAIGGTAGAIIGRRMDKQAEEIEREIKDAEVNRVEEGILVTMGDKLLFGFDSADLNGQATSELREFADILQKYEDTNIMIEGHTDDTGKTSYNQQLSERRAASVASTLRSAGVSSARIQTKGYGESQPVYDNTTDDGRAMNRRVEIAIYASDKMKQDAANGNLPD